MPIYTVHAPPLRDEETAPDPERFAFVRDGFHFWAFLVTPLWMIWRRLWLVLLLYFLALLLMQIGLRLAGATPVAQSAASVLLSLLIGFEAATLRRWTLNRRGWTQLGVVSGRNREAAERRFFDAWLRQVAWERAREPVPPPAPMAPGAGQAATDIVGLFPEPQPRR